MAKESREALINYFVPVLKERGFTYSCEEYLLRFCFYFYFLFCFSFLSFFIFYYFFSFFDSFPFFLSLFPFLESSLFLVTV